MQELNKKASSESVITVVLIVIAVASIGLAFNSVKNIFDTGEIQLSSQFNCLDFQTEISPTIKLTKACLNSEGEIEALIQRNSKEVNIVQLSFVIGEETWTCSQETCSENCEILPAGTARTYYLIPEQNPIDEKLEIRVGTCLIGEIKITNC